jgi:uncharacterized Zn finger protein
MSILLVASGQSVYCGYEYAQAKKVLCMEQFDDGAIKAAVSGSDGNVYDVLLDIVHPKNLNVVARMRPERESYVNILLRSTLLRSRQRRKSIFEN